MRLREIVRAERFQVEAKSVGTSEPDGLRVTYWQLRMSGAWTLPAVELVRDKAKSTVIMVADGGRTSAAEEAERLLAAGHRVVAVDPFYFGESKIAKRDFLFAILVSALGGRPLGLQASQLAATARWLQTDRQTGPVTLVALGPRSSLFCLAAAALEPQAIAQLKLHGCLGSLKEVIEQNKGANQTPELLCFGLLEAFDVKHLIALVSPRPVVMVAPQ